MKQKPIQVNEAARVLGSQGGNVTKKKPGHMKRISKLGIAAIKAKKAKQPK